MVNPDSRRHRRRRVQLDSFCLGAICGGTFVAVGYLLLWALTNG